MEVEDLDMMVSLSPDSRGQVTAGLEWSEADLPREAVTAETGIIPVTAPRLLVPGIEVTEELSDIGIDTVQETWGSRSPTSTGTPPATWWEVTLQETLLQTLLETFPEDFKSWRLTLLNITEHH